MFCPSYTKESLVQGINMFQHQNKCLKYENKDNWLQNFCFVLFFLVVKDLSRLHNLDMVTRRAVIEKKTITLSLPPRLQTGSSQLLEPQSPWRAILQGCLCKNRWNSQSNGSQTNQNLSLQCIATQVRTSYQIPAMMIQAKSVDQNIAKPKFHLHSCTRPFEKLH